MAILWCKNLRSAKGFVLSWPSNYVRIPTAPASLGGFLQGLNSRIPVHLFAYDWVVLLSKSRSGRQNANKWTGILELLP